MKKYSLMICCVLTLLLLVFPVFAVESEYPVFQADTSVMLDLAEGEEAWFQFVPGCTEEYTFFSDGNYDTIGYLYDVEMNLLAHNDDSGSLDFSITYSLEEGQTYFLSCRTHSGQAGKFVVTLNANHAFSSTVLKESNCMEEGLERLNCQICGVEKEVPILKVPHSLSDGICATCGEPYIAAGQCGETICWQLDQNYILTLSGSGAMPDYHRFSTDFIILAQEDPSKPGPPWKDYYDQITAVEINPGITYIGDYAFYAFTQVKSFTFPEGVRNVGDSVFDYCYSLEQITFPESFEKIDTSFIGCYDFNCALFYGDAPICSDYFLANADDEFQIIYNSSKDGWDDAMEAWVLPNYSRWIDLNEVISAEEFCFEKEAYSLEPGQSIQLLTNADSYTQLYLELSNDNPECLFVSQSGIVTAIAPGRSVVTARTADQKYSASCVVTVSEADISQTRQTVLDGRHFDNYNNNFYSVKDKPKYSYITEWTDGQFERIDNIPETGIVISRYDSQLALVDEKIIAPELPVFGAFFAGEDYNFLVFGQNNPEESDDTEVLRIVKYSKDYERISACSVFGANTTIPFRAGTAELAEVDGVLYLHTCHQMYVSSDGLHHQANMTFVIDQETMTVTDSWYDVMNLSYGYVSHSFSQRIRTTDEYIFRVDHGDAYPRAVCITRCKVGDKITNVEYTTVLKIQGQFGANSTGVSLGGFELSSDNCLIVGNSVDQSDPETYDSSGCRNVFLAVHDHGLSQKGIYWLTDYTEEDQVTVYTPQLTKVADNLFLILWNEYHISERCDETYLLLVDGNGKALCEPLKTNVNLSDCQPVVTSDGLVTWYTSQKDCILYQISWRQMLSDRFSVLSVVSKPFQDVDPSAYYNVPVWWAVENQITSGMTQTTFGPENICTRAQVVTFLWRASGEPEPAAKNNPFKDVLETDYFYKAVLWAVEKGITNGISADQFAPSQSCTRAQVATFLWRSQGKPTAANTNHPFTDIKSGDYYFEAVLWAVEAGVTNGMSPTTFAPDETCTRGQIVTFLYRALN